MGGTWTTLHCMWPVLLMPEKTSCHPQTMACSVQAVLLQPVLLTAQGAAVMLYEAHVMHLGLHPLVHP